MNLFTNFEIMIMVSVIGFLSFVVILLSIMEVVSKHSEKKKIQSKTMEFQIIDDMKEEVNKEECDELSLENIDITKKMPVVEPLKVEVSEEEQKKIDDIKSALFDDKEDLEVQEQDVEVKVQTVLNTMENNVTVENDDLLIEDIDTPGFSLANESMITNNTPSINPIEMLEVEPVKKAKLELENIEKELEKPLSLEDTISNLEAMEEENAVISYQELLSATQELSVVNMEEEGNEPISLNEVFEQFDMSNPTKPIEELSLDKVESEELESVSYIAPSNIETENLNEIQLENTANLEKLDKEIRKTNKFLHILNELKKNLD